MAGGLEPWQWVAGSGEFLTAWWLVRTGLSRWHRGLDLKPETPQTFRRWPYPGTVTVSPPGHRIDAYCHCDDCKRARSVQAEAGKPPGPTCTQCNRPLEGLVLLGEAKGLCKRCAFRYVTGGQPYLEHHLTEPKQALTDALAAAIAATLALESDP